MGWVSPTSHIDGAKAWSNGANAYDGSLSTYATAGSKDYSIELLIDAILCSKVRIYTSGSYDTEPITAATIEVFYDGAYNTLLDGAGIAFKEWVEYEIGSTETVTKVQLTLNNFLTFNCYEFEFWSVEAAPATPPAIKFCATPRSYYY